MCPVVALLFSFCVMWCVCLCVYGMACIRRSFIDFAGLFCVCCSVRFFLFLVCMCCLCRVVLLFVVSLVCRACMVCCCCVVLVFAFFAIV